ncbi:50S ribosomal protein L25/general stress protein Ctc [Pontivivens nitratireducens]|uniref:Large ribosomal subunit protein bL25 n=1 Tax=Pontivivens nitratireducens TaxID=2758038 RepID=A0A6G7VIE5_9RHOB|nr:50S ribosomal protein L25/general stress protein Ctc [Pontibrevibacter nitratireducens]QIK39635.1 50S ribosomal protein L25/general stress protein Ctc [Pontibrevibacter nitratireducens]
MAENTILEAVARDASGKGAARAARREGLVPGVIYGGNAEPQSISVKFNELLKLLKAGKFLSTLMNVKVDGKDNKVICRAVQRDIVKDLPTHVDFLRLSDRSRINLYIPVVFENEETCPGIKKGGTLIVVRSEVELKVTANNIPDQLVVDLAEFEIGDTITISDIVLPEGTRPMITGRDFVIANIQAPGGLSTEDEDEDGETEVIEQTDDTVMND